MRSFWLNRPSGLKLRLTCFFSVIDRIFLLKRPKKIKSFPTNDRNVPAKRKIPAVWSAANGPARLQHLLYVKRNLPRRPSVVVARVDASCKLNVTRGGIWPTADSLLLLICFQYRSTDFVASGPGKLRLVYTPDAGGETLDMEVYDFQDGGGVGMAMYNTDKVRNYDNLWQVRNQGGGETGQFPPPENFKNILEEPKTFLLSGKTTSCNDFSPLEIISWLRCWPLLVFFCLKKVKKLIAVLRSQSKAAWCLFRCSQNNFVFLPNRVNFALFVCLLESLWCSNCCCSADNEPQKHCPENYTWAFAFPVLEALPRFVASVNNAHQTLPAAAAQFPAMLRDNQRCHSAALTSEQTVVTACRRFRALNFTFAPQSLLPRSRSRRESFPQLPSGGDTPTPTPTSHHYSFNCVAR